MEQAIQAAIDWWLQWTKKDIVPQNTGDSDIDLWAMYANLLSSPPSTDVAIDQFAEHLHSGIKQQLEISDQCILSTDYGAEGVLHDALIGTGLTNAFPCKTVMICTKTRVTVACGYGAKSITIYEESI